MAEEKQGDGFELNGRFYKWAVSDKGKDLMLIDRFTGMPVHEFFETIEDEFDRGRAPILLTLIATSIRAAHQDWTVERIVRTVTDLNLSAVEFIDGDKDEEEGEDGPPAEAADAATGDSSSDES